MQEMFLKICTFHWIKKVCKMNPKIMNCKHKWIVYSTALCPPTIMVHCGKCDKCGGITDYEMEEWYRAFSASSEPYPWQDNSRVEVYE